MKLKRGSTSVRRLIFIADSSSTTGAGLTGLTDASGGLVAYYFAGDLSNEVQISLVSATLGTFTSGGFIQVDATNMPGWYEVGIPNAALDGGNEVAIQYRGATNMVPVNIYIELDTVDYQTAIFGGMASYTQPTGFLAATFPGGTVASTTNITAGTIDLVSAPNATALQAAADAFLNRNVAGGSSTGRLVKHAFAKLRNKWDIYDNGGTPTMRIYDTDDVAVLWQEALSTDVSTSDVVTGADPT